jgi:hypothetical protein
MNPSLAALLHQPCPLKRQLYPYGAQLDPFFFSQLLGEGPHVEIEILLPLQTPDPFHHLHGNPSRARLALAPVVSALVSVHVIAPTPTPHLAVADAPNLRRLPPTNLLRQRSQDHCLNLPGPLHADLAVTLHVHPDMSLTTGQLKSGHFTCQFDRTYHVSTIC